MKGATCLRPPPPPCLTWGNSSNAARSAAVQKPPGAGKNNRRAPGQSRQRGPAARAPPRVLEAPPAPSPRFHAAAVMFTSPLPREYLPDMTSLASALPAKEDAPRIHPRRARPRFPHRRAVLGHPAQGQACASIHHPANVHSVSVMLSSCRSYVKF